MLPYDSFKPVQAQIWKGFGLENPEALLGGSWVVIGGVISPPNMGYKYSYPTYDPI